jgi:hypothetical protein
VSVVSEMSSVLSHYIFRSRGLSIDCKINERNALLLKCRVKWQSRKLHNEELRDLYSSPSINRIIKSRRMRWADHVARMERRGTLIDY